MQKIELEEYARILCRAKSEYSYPSVTCFDFDAFLQGASPVTYIRKHGNMLEVEELIKRQLVSHDLEEVKDGLSNVLFWGFASQPGRQKDRVGKFRSEVPQQKLECFRKLVANETYVGLWNLKKIGLPQFTQMSFTSKLLMFLSPSTNPVLDLKIGRSAKEQNVPPLSNLTIRTSMPLSQHNVRIYGEWSSWCIDVARQVNELPSSPCRDLRAVDVERAVFHCIDADRDAAVKLLLGPTPK